MLDKNYRTIVASDENPARFGNGTSGDFLLCVFVGNNRIIKIDFIFEFLKAVEVHAITHFVCTETGADFGTENIDYLQNDLPATEEKLPIGVCGVIVHAFLDQIHKRNLRPEFILGCLLKN